jgi:hypothetical protein
VLRERVYAIEDVAAGKGLPLREMVEKWQPSPAQTQELAKMRHTLMQCLFRTIDTEVPPMSDVSEIAGPLPPRSGGR